MRSTTRSNTAISFPQSVVSNQVKAVVSTESSASHKEKHLYKRQMQLYAITEVRWNSGPQMAMHCPKYETILLIADSEKNKKWTLELLLLKCDLHFSFLYKKGLVICTKNKKK